MTKSVSIVATALLFGLTLAFGSAVAGDGSCTKGKKGEDGGTASVIVPAQPLA